jgi:hypothetical protein
MFDVSRAAKLRENRGSFRHPGKGRGAAVPVTNVIEHGSFEFRDSVKGAATNALLGDFREEPFDQVQPGSAGRSEVQVISWASLKPSADGFMRVGPIIIQNDVDHQFLRDSPVDAAQEPKKLLMPMAGLSLGNHVAVDQVQCREQSRGPVPFVIVRLPFRQPRPEGQRRLRAVERLHLALLIHA